MNIVKMNSISDRVMVVVKTFGKKVVKLFVLVPHNVENQ